VLDSYYGAGAKEGEGEIGAAVGHRIQRNLSRSYE